MKWADYCISKLSLNEENGLIDKVIVHKVLGESVTLNGEERDRNWMVQQVGNGKILSCIKKSESGRWDNIGSFSYDGSLFSWFKVPRNITRRKTFISYYHHDDQAFKEKFKNLFDDLIVNKSVEKDDVDSNNEDEYIKQLIQKDYLADTTVLVVLIGPNTKCRMHVDWEISGALNLKVGDSNAGLLGIQLPTHPDFGKGKHTYDLLPARLSDNLKTGYAIIRDWTTDRVKMQSYIEEAFEKRSSMADKRINSRIQMDKDTCE